MKIRSKVAFMMTIAVMAIGFIWTPTSADAQVIVLRNQNRLSYTQVGQTINRVEASSDRFRRQFDAQMDRNRRRDDDRFVEIVNQFEVSVDELRREFDRTRNWWEIRNSVSNVVREAQDVNVMMNSLSFRRNLEVQWNQLRNDINSLADTFDLPGLNGGGWNGGNGNWNGGNGNWGSMPRAVRPPSWAVGTFESTGRRGDQITLTIYADGNVSVINNGQTFNGAYTRRGLWVNGDTSTLQQTRNGIRTYNQNEGVWTNYRRGTGGYTGGGGYVDPNTGSRPPDWAIGTFVTNSNSDFSMTIDASGRVTVYTGGQTYYGTYNGQNNTLFLNGDTSTVQQSGRGIRTYNASTGQTTNYRRQ
jgi:hypothetical protein